MDVGDALDISWQGVKTLETIPASWKGLLAVNTPGEKQHMTIINEAALYKLAFRSRKSEAEKFTNWVAAEVLPQIRKTGTYTTGKAQVRTIVDEEGTPWFVAKDVCRILGILWNGQASIRAIPADWQMVGNLPTSHGTKPTLLISEPALYKLAFRAQKPEADRFTNWVTHEVLPSIRKTGTYTTGKADVRTTIDERGEPWFVGNDVCKPLGIGNSRQAAAGLRKEDVTTSYILDARGCKQATTVISESGLYTLILRSRKPEAEPFQYWVTHEVLPSIRKTGSYTTGKAVITPNFDDPIVAAKAIRGLGADERGEDRNSDASPKGLRGAPQ